MARSKPSTPDDQPAERPTADRTATRTPQRRTDGSRQPGNQTSTPTTPDDGCPDCNGTVVTTDNERYCEDCGRVLEVDRLDRGREWRGDATDPDATGYNLARCNGGARNPATHDYGLGGTFNPNSTSGSRQLSRLERLQRQAQFDNKRERNLAYGFTIIQRLTTDLGTADAVHERACTLFRDAQAADLLLGRSIELVAGACTYAALRDLDIPRLPSDVAAHVQLDDDDVAGKKTTEQMLQRAYGELCRELDLQMVPLSPADHVPRVTSALGLPAETRARAMYLARLAEGHQQFVGKQPSGVAAAAVYLAADQTAVDVTQTAVGDELDVSAPTLRDNRDQLRELLAADPADAADESAAGDQDGPDVETAPTPARAPSDGDGTPPERTDRVVAAASDAGERSTGRTVPAASWRPSSGLSQPGAAGAWSPDGRSPGGGPADASGRARLHPRRG